MSTFIRAQCEVSHLANEFPIDQQIINQIQKESEENVINALAFLENYLDVSFPEIISSIQTKQSSLSVLTRVKDYVELSHYKGKLEDKESEILLNYLDNALNNIDNINAKWESVDLMS